MKWIIGELKVGDHIRVKREFYFHHGVYIGNDEVIHFTGENGDSINNAKDVLIRKTSIEFFAHGGIVEKAELSLGEKIHKRKEKDILKIANDSLGQGGYDILHNNCEDFANKCCYKKNLTSQVDAIKRSI